VKDKNTYCDTNSIRLYFTSEIIDLITEGPVAEPINITVENGIINGKYCII